MRKARIPTEPEMKIFTYNKTNGYMLIFEFTRPSVKLKYFLLSYNLKTFVCVVTR